MSLILRKAHCVITFLEFSWLIHSPAFRWHCNAGCICITWEIQCAIATHKLGCGNEIAHCAAVMTAPKALPTLTVCDNDVEKTKRTFRAFIAKRKERLWIVPWTVISIKARTFLIWFNRRQWKANANSGPYLSLDRPSIRWHGMINRAVK